MARRRVRGRHSAAGMPFDAVIEISRYNLDFIISDSDSNNNPISDTNGAENIGFFANALTDIEVTDIRLDGEDSIFEDPAVYPEAGLLVSQESSTEITYTLANNENSFLGISEADGSIVSTSDLNDQDVEVLSFSLDLETVGREIDVDLAVNSLDYIIEEDLLSDLSIELETFSLDNRIVLGSSGDDLLVGASGNDSIFGGAGNFLLGENGNDTLNGNDGNDFLGGGFGTDILSGGRGGDTFRLANPGGAGFDTITDFNRSEGDVFQTTTGSQDDYSLSFGSSSGDAAFDTLIEYQGNTIAIVEDTTTVDLDTDFVFL